ncbi:MAG TPA: hypothetical protein VEA38_04070 [Terriglobales bacterium]|nr:hypothetical protein [Terriglobales bacterium]
MPVVPSGYHEWCEGRGVSPFHPEDWTEADHEAFIAWKRARVDEWKAALEAMAGGNAEYIAAHEPRMRADAEVRLTRNPYATCPCHPQLARPERGWHREPAITPADVRAWRAADPFERVDVPLSVARARIQQERDPSTRPGVAAALEYITSFAPRTGAARHGKERLGQPRHGIACLGVEGTGMARSCGTR